jgi:hypothetical protein
VRAILIFALAMALGGCAAATPDIVSQTPGSIDLQCAGCSQQTLADAAQQHCRQYSLDAQEKGILRDGLLIKRQVFDCVNNANGPAQAKR